MAWKLPLWERENKESDEKLSQIPNWTEDPPFSRQMSYHSANLACGSADGIFLPRFLPFFFK